MRAINENISEGKRWSPYREGKKTRYDVDKWQTTYEIMDDFIDGLDPVLLGRIYQGYDKDIDAMLDDVVKEAYRILYGADNVGRGTTPSLRYITELESELEEQLRCNSLTYFASNTLHLEMNWHHIEWAWLIENFLMNCVLAARDHGKSFFFSNAYPAWKMYRYDKMSRNPSKLNGRLGYIFSNSTTQAVDLLDILKDSIEDNDILREKLYPTIRENWSKTSIKTKNGCRLRAKGMGNTVRGAHPGYIILDDVLKDNVLYSKLQRDKSKTYFNSAILGMLIPGGQLTVVGTPFHYADLYSVFKDSVDFTYRKYPAIDAQGNVLWSNRHSKQDLEMRRRITGKIIFTREYLVEPVSDDTAMFPEGILQRALTGMRGFSYVENIDAFPIKFKRVITGGDFAISAKVGADWTCFATFGIDENESMWLINLYHQKGVGFTEQKRVLRSIWRRFRPDVMYLEANQFQKIYSESLADETSMPVKPFVTTGKKKNSLEEGVPGLAILFENSKMKLPYQTPKDVAITDKVLDEFRSIGWTEKGIEGIGEHDDIVMAFFIARQAYISGGMNGFLADFI